MKIRKLITTGILVTFVIQALVVLAYSNSNNLGIANFPKHDLVEKLSKEPNIFGNYFFENKGQFDESQIKFYGYMPGGSIGFGESKIFLRITESNQIVTAFFEDSQVVKPVALGQQESTMSYFIGNNAAYSNVMKCEKIAYYDLWPGIDLFYKITKDGIKYEYHVNVGGNVKDIKIRYEGLDTQPDIQSDKLMLSFGKHQIIDEGLRVFQENGLDVDAKFITKDGNTFGFDVSNFDTTRKLIIDPLIYSTFIGGSGFEVANDLILDADGNAYIVGSTTSIDFPTSATAYNDTYSGPGDDIIVLKLSADGSTLLYSTFIGGNETDYGYSIAVDDAGNAIITGCTDSNNFPTVNAYDDTYNGKDTQWGDCFVLKLSSDGSSLLFSTFFGGSGDDIARGLAIDTTNNIILTGETTSTDLPLLNEIDDEHNGIMECFFVKITANGASLIFSTYFGETEQGQMEVGITVDIASNGDIYFLGYCFTDNITMTDETVFGSYHGDVELFLVKLSESGSLLYSSYIGGDGYDRAKKIKLDDANNLYIIADTTSMDIPLINAFDDSYGFNIDAYLMKLNMTGTLPEILFSTYLGGDDRDLPQDLCVDSDGNVYITGQTSSDDFPLTENAYDKEKPDSKDAFLTVFSSDGSKLQYSTYIGGNSTEWGFCIEVSNTSEVVLAGTTKSDDFPTEAAYDDTFSGDTDIFILKIEFDFYQETASWPLYWVITTIIATSTIIALISKRKTKK